MQLGVRHREGGGLDPRALKGSADPQVKERESGPAPRQDSRPSAAANDPKSAHHLTGYAE